MTVKITSLSQGKEMGTSTIEATFMRDGNLIPLKVNQNDRPDIYNEIQELIKKAGDIEEAATDLFNLMSPEAKVQEQIKSSFYLSNSLSLRNGRIYFGDNKLEDTLSTHMLSLLDEGNTPKDEKMWRSYVKFLDNLFQNANAEIRKQLFRWMDYENKAGNGFGITDDGCIVGYKGCGGTILEPTSKFTGHAIVDGVEYNGHIPNKVGSVVQMPRSAVQFDPKVGCAQGLHVGTRDYATSWAPILLLVKVNPRDVVSVPFECNSQKMRVCEYTVLKVTDEREAHQRYFETNDSCPGDFDTLSVDEAYDLLGEKVYIEYDEDESFEGTLTDVYTDGNAFIEIEGEDEVLEVELERVTYYSVDGMEVEDVEDEEDFSEFELSLIDAYELLENEEEIEVQYDSKSHIGVVVNVFEEYGKDPGIVVRSEDGEYKHIKLYRIEDWCVTGEIEDDEDFTEDSEEEIEITDLLGAVVEVKYDGKSFSGEVIDLVETSGSEGIVIRNDNFEYKHIKLHRIESVTVLEFEIGEETLNEGDHCCETGECLAEIGPYEDLLKIPLGASLIVAYRDEDSVLAVAGTLQSINKCELEMTIQKYPHGTKVVNFTDIVSIQVRN